MPARSWRASWTPTPGVAVGAAGPGHRGGVSWICSLPGPVGVAYEAGPTGFGLARALAAVGVRCVVVAPSKLERPPGDRVKTDRRDAERLARLLRIGELPGVRVPSVAEEAARDLLRARQDARGDLMRARHRLSKLLLRRGLVWPDSAWTRAHQRWLQGLRWEQPWVRVAFEEALGAVLAVQTRRDRLDSTIGELAAQPAWAPLVGRLGCLRGVGVLTAVGLAVEVGDWQRFTGATIGAYLGLTPSEQSSGGQRSQGRSPRPATATPAGCWSRRPGITASPTGPAKHCGPARPANPPWSDSEPSRATIGSTSAGDGWTLAASGPPSARSRSPVSLPGGAGVWPSWTPERPPRLAGGRHATARGATRDRTMRANP